MATHGHSHGQRSLVGYSPEIGLSLDTTEQLPLYRLVCFHSVEIVAAAALKSYSTISGKNVQCTVSL